MFREVEEPAQSYRAIDQEPPYFDAGTFKLALKHIVQKAGSEPEVGKDVADADLDQVGHDEIISLRHGLEHKSIDLAVELEDVRVHRFPGIILLTGPLIGPGKGIKRFVRLSLLRRRGRRSLVRNWPRVAHPLWLRCAGFPCTASDKHHHETHQTERQQTKGNHYPGLLTPRCSGKRLLRPPSSRSSEQALGSAGAHCNKCRGARQSILLKS
jgi:hypothetical protein